MTEIKFYHNAADRLLAACSITAKAVQRGLRVVVYAPDEALAQRYDSLLWTAQPTSFVPHVKAGSPLADRSPVVMVKDLAEVDCNDVLINLDGELPPSFARFSTLVEIVSGDEAEKAQARRRWQFYKERGYPIVAHDLARAATA